ncbi:MAG TPA: TIR domain-containing protein [Solirubrobacteraceae bacterium]|jgi:predicted nucleotide-binding protein
MLQVSIPIAHELLGQYIKQGEALVQRASLVGDFSDYESWKSARRQWIEPTEQALEHMYGGSAEAREFLDAVTCVEGVKRWQEQYSTDLKCVKEAIELLTVLRGDLAFVEGSASAAGGSLSPGAVGTPAELGPGIDAADERPPLIEQQPVEAVPLETAPTPSQPDEPGRENGRRFDEPVAHAERVAQAEPERDERPVSAELEPAQRASTELAHHGATGSTPAEREPADAPSPAPAQAQQVLLAHGRDEGWKQAVEHLLEQAGEHEIRIVNRRAEERGRLADVLSEETRSSPGSRYAVILLTADDVGGPRLESADEPFFSTRAHQQVVFEMGFLVAALSPGRVCVLYEDGVELPYDLEGVSHVRLDLAGTWQPKLLLHLRRAGFDYDMNKLVSV